MEGNVFLLMTGIKPKVFKGLFRKLEDATKFASSHYSNVPYFITDLHLDPITTFQEFEKCKDCYPDHRPDANQVTLIKVKHGLEWHFLAVLRDDDEADRFMELVGDQTFQDKYVTLLFSENVDQYFNSLDMSSSNLKRPNSVVIHRNLHIYLMLLLIFSTQVYSLLS